MWMSLVYLFRKFPTEERELLAVMEKLGVTTASSSKTVVTRTATDVAVLQERVIDALRFRRESWLWLIAVIAALTSLASAIAAWVAVATR